MQGIFLENVKASDLLDVLNEVKATLAEIKQERKALEIGKAQSLENDLLTVKEVTEIFKIDATTLWAWSKKGKVNKYRIGKRVFYKRNELETLLNNSKIGA
jgi:hypothetical protein